MNSSLCFGKDDTGIYAPLTALQLNMPERQLDREDGIDEEEENNLVEHMANSEEETGVGVGCSRKIPDY